MAEISLTPEDGGVEETFTVAAVARRVGVAPATLRTWARRYGLGPSSHTYGTHRRYSRSDLAKLVLMRRLISMGISPGDAATRAKTHEGDVQISDLVHEVNVAEELVAAICSAAESLDREFIVMALRKELQEYGVIHCWQNVIVPVLTIVGKQWELTGEGIETEHLLTELITAALRETVPREFVAINARPVLLACVGEELHSLALHALAAALAELNIATNFLGPRTPLSALSVFVTKTAPPALFLWAQLSENGDPQLISGLPKVRPAPKVILGGPGWDPQECSNATFAGNLQLACNEISQAVGA